MNLLCNSLYTVISEAFCQSDAYKILPAEQMLGWERKIIDNVFKVYLKAKLFQGIPLILWVTSLTTYALVQAYEPLKLITHYGGCSGINC